MRLIFVRHGHPNYAEDCLTELGHRHAQAAATRLSEEKINRIYSSSCGRAAQTAQHIADMQGLQVELCDFMREIAWGSVNEEPIPHNGHPWKTVDDMVASGVSLMREDWANDKYFCNNKVVSHFSRVAREFDGFLESLGYKREDNLYRVCKGNSENIVMVSHAGSSSAVLSHIFNLPMPFVCAAISPNYTGITVVSFSDKDGTLISPQFEIMNDARHIAEDAIEVVFDN